MEEKKIVDKYELSFISYLDDDNKKKDQWVIILEKGEFGVKFKFKDTEDNVFLPWYRVLKIKERGVEHA